MNMTRTLVVVSFAAVVASCQTPPKEKSVVNVAPSEPQTVHKTTYLPGTVVNSAYPLPDSSLTPDVPPLTEEHITGDDIEPDAAMATAVAWSKQYHDLASTYDVLRGWIIGVRAGQNIPPTIVSDPP